MAKSDRTDQSSAGPRMSRRLFVRNMTGAFVAALAGSSLLEGCASPQKATPPIRPTDVVQPTVRIATAALAASADAPSAPPTAATPENLTTEPVTGAMTLVDALKARRSADGFKPEVLPKETLLGLLWAAWGINRPDSGKRTAPSAMNTQEIDIYVLLDDGTYVYDAQQNQLESVSDEDLRAKAKALDAPVHLIFVADYVRYRAGDRATQELWSAAHTGFIGQNVYLYCAAEGLASRFYANFDKAALQNALKLRTDQAVVFGQAIGYPDA